MVLPMESGAFSRASEMSPALTHVFSSPSHSFQLTNAPPTATFAAHTNHRRKRSIGIGSLLAAIALSTQTTRAHQQPISPRSNYSSIPPSVPLGPSFWASTLPISTSTPPCRIPKYMRLHFNIIPNEIIAHNNLCNIVTPDGWVYIEIRTRMYGLPQAGILANQLIKKPLPPKGIINANIHLVCGTTSGETSRSA
jgi:hypothetical protein